MFVLIYIRATIFTLLSLFSIFFTVGHGFNASFILWETVLPLLASASVMSIFSKEAPFIVTH